MYSQSFMGQRIQHHTGWEDEILITGLLGMHFSPHGIPDLPPSWLREQKGEPSQKPFSQ